MKSEFTEHLSSKPDQTKSYYVLYCNIGNAVLLQAHKDAVENSMASRSELGYLVRKCRACPNCPIADLITFGNDVESPYRPEPYAGY